jgi:hypothetical protein
MFKRSSTSGFVFESRSKTQRILTKEFVKLSSRVDKGEGEGGESGVSNEHSLEKKDNCRICWFLSTFHHQTSCANAETDSHFKQFSAYKIKIFG